MIYLKASDLPRIMECAASVAMVAGLAELPPESDSAREGTAAHWLAEQMVKGIAAHETATVAENGHALDDTMHAAAREFMAIVLNREGNRLVEQRLDFLVGDNVTVRVKCDTATFVDDTLYVDEFKYGWSIVEPEENWQMVAQTIGALRQKWNLPAGIAPARVIFGVYQPRPYHADGPYRQASYSFAEFREIATRMFDRLRVLTGPLTSGPHCGKCPAAQVGSCPAYQRATYNAIDVSMDGVAVEIDPDALGRELLTLERAAALITQRLDWAKDIAKRRIIAGQQVAGFAVEPQYGNRSWKDFEAAKRATNIDLTVSKPCTPAEAKRRGMSDAQLAELSAAPLIGQKLVRYDADRAMRKKLKGKVPKQ